MERMLEYLPKQNKEDLLKTMLIASGATVGLTVSLYFGKIWNDYQYFKRRGIPGPKPSMFMGHTYTLRKGRDQSHVVQEMTKEYGKTFGIFEGHVPYLVTSDLEVIQEVFIKQFNNFSIRKKFPLTAPENADYKNLISSNLPGRWKRMRLIMNPTFSSLKIREMGPLLIKCVDRLIETFENRQEEEIGISIFLKRFTMDSIWNCAFGLDIDLQKDPDNLFLKNSCQHIQSTTEIGFFQTLTWIFEELDPIIYPIFKAWDFIKVNIFRKDINCDLWLEKKIGQLVDMRIEKKVDRKDYMQLLLNVMSDNNFSKSNDLKNLNVLTNVHLDKQLTRKEVEANLVLFMIAGYETTSTALSYASHVLATHLDVQETLYEEVTKQFGQLEPDTDNIKDLAYLDLFTKEVLRYHPIAFITRRCTQKTTVKGIDIMPGVCVRVDHRTINFDEEIWGSDAHLFNPLRHKEKRSPLVYLAFGLGPRNCIAMKFAIVEMKLAIVKLVLKFEFGASASTPVKLETVEGIVTGPKDFSIILKKRV